MLQCHRLLWSKVAVEVSVCVEHVGRMEMSNEWEYKKCGEKDTEA